MRENEWASGTEGGTLETDDVLYTGRHSPTGPSAEDSGEQGSRLDIGLALD